MPSGFVMIVEAFSVFFLTEVCDEPHPLLVKEMIEDCTKGNIEDAYKIMAHLWQMGYSPEDIITSIFRVCKIEDMPEFLKLEFIKVKCLQFEF